MEDRDNSELRIEETDRKETDRNDKKKKKKRKQDPGKSNILEEAAKCEPAEAALPAHATNTGDENGINSVDPSECRNRPDDAHSENLDQHIETPRKSSTIEINSTNSTPRSKLGSFVDPFLAVTSKTKDMVNEAAIKPIKNAAIKVKDDMEFLVRDPKEFAKQKKSEVEDLVFPSVPDVDDPEWQAKLAKQRTVHLKDFPRFMFIMVVMRAAYLNFCGGFVNAVAIAGLFGMGITHLTGITTMAAVRMVNPPVAGATGSGALSCWWFLTMLTAFCMGSILGGIITGDARYRWRGRQALTLVFEALFLIIAYICVKFGISLGQDKDVGFRSKWWGAVFICLASGTQNSLTSNYTAIVVRSTHTTGLVADIGMAIGQMINTGTLKYLWKLQVWGPVLMGFICGAFLGAELFQLMGAEALLVAVALVGILAGGTGLDMWYKELRRRDHDILGFHLGSKVHKEFKEF